MRIAPDTIVSLDYELFDTEGELIEKSRSPIAYLHGGYGGMFPLVEASLSGQVQGTKIEVHLEPEEAFGVYHDDLVRHEPRANFPKELAIGMQFEGRAEGQEHGRVFTVTDVTEERVVVDGNHPLAGRSVIFACTVASVRLATPEEIQHRHAHGTGGHHHH